jgi:hypothetical protein
MALITANPADFKSFKGLVVENWASRRSPSNATHIILVALHTNALGTS